MGKVKYEIHGVVAPGTIVHKKFGRINLHEQPDKVLKEVAETSPHLVRVVEATEEVVNSENSNSKKPKNRK